MDRTSRTSEEHRPPTDIPQEEPRSGHSRWQNKVIFILFDEYAYRCKQNWGFLACFLGGFLQIANKEKTKQKHYIGVSILYLVLN